MLRNAPKFHEVAKRIVEITQDCILVAHNTSFDYRILRTEFRRLGYDFVKQTLCTVELSKKLIPGQEKYKLGTLVKALGIPMSDRHRASGDALATVKLFKLLLDKDSDKTIVNAAIKSGIDVAKKIAPRLSVIVNDLPSKTGVYYIHNDQGDIIYIGKSKNIKKRLTQHFTNDNRKSKRMQLDVAAVTYENTGNELIALLKESEEIKHNKPKYNRALRKTLYTYQLSSFKDNNGYYNLTIEKADGRKKAITTFTNFLQAKSNLFKITEEFKLCQKLTGLHQSDGNCFSYSIKECNGACLLEESADEYNERVLAFFEKSDFISW